MASPDRRGRQSLEGELSPAPAIPVATDDAAAAPARLDAFVSYRRVPEDTGFVDYLEGALADRGKHVWVDRAKIEPAADWSERIALGIRNARALIFVITPESVVSRECLRELDAAIQLHKLIVPVVLRYVGQDEQLPESLRRLNWIVFTTDRDRERALGEVIAALEEDLDWRDAHTRLAVRTQEWTDAQRDRSFLLRGSDLSRAEDWLGRASQHQKTPPTALQTEYILASRKASVRTQRTWRGALSVGLVIALALAAVAFVQRNTARTEARIAQSRALAAEATSDLSSHPEQSVQQALNATQLSAAGPAEQSLRLAMAQDRLRMVIRTGAGSGAVAAWNPVLAQIAVTSPKNSVQLWNTRTGRLTQILRVTGGQAVTQLLYDPRGSRLAAVSSVGSVSMWDVTGHGAASPVRTDALNALIKADYLDDSLPGARNEYLSGAWAGPAGDAFDVYGSGLSNVLIFEPASGTVVPLFRQPLQVGAMALAPSPDGNKLLVGGDLIDFTNRSQTSLSPQPDSVPGPYCWFPDGSAVVTSTEVVAGGPERIYKASTGTQSATMQTTSTTNAVACSTGAANEWVAAGDVGGHVILRLATGTVVPLDGHSDAISAIASSLDGRYLATASLDGTARIWDARTGHLVTVLTGDGAALTDVRFGLGGGLALTVDKLGTVRIWDTGIGEPLTVLSRPGPGQSVPLRFTDSGTQVLGAYLVTSTGPAAAVTSASVVAWDARSGQLVRQVNLPGIAASAAPCSATLQHIGDTAALGIMSGGTCGIPPSSGLVLAVPVPRPLNTLPAEDNNVLELLALAVSPDGRYAAYARASSIAVLDTGGRVVATLPVASAPVGLSFTSSSGDLLVVTDKAVYLWKPLSGRPPVVVPMPSTPIDATVSPAGAELAAVGTGGTVGVWSTADGRRLRTFNPSGKNPDSYYGPTPLRVAFSPDGTVVASGNADGTVDFWDIATGHRIAVRTVANWPILELSPAEHGSDLLAVDWPAAGSGPNPAGAAAVLNADTSQVIATYLSPAPREAPVVPAAALSADGNFMFAGALGLAPSAPAGTTAAYQVSTGQLIADVQGAAEPPPTSYSESPLRPWSPDGREFLAGTAIYACASCGPLTSLQAAAAARISWSVPLSAWSDHPPAASPYG